MDNLQGQSTRVETSNLLRPGHLIGQRADGQVEIRGSLGTWTISEVVRRHQVKPVSFTNFNYDKVMTRNPRQASIVGLILLAKSANLPGWDFEWVHHNVLLDTMSGDEDSPTTRLSAVAYYLTGTSYLLRSRNWERYQAMKRSLISLKAGWDNESVPLPDWMDNELVALGRLAAIQASDAWDQLQASS